MTLSSSQARLMLTGAVGLLCECSVGLGNGQEKDELRDCIENLISDWCEETGWTYKRILHSIEILPPENPIG